MEEKTELTALGQAIEFLARRSAKNSDQIASGAQIKLKTLKNAKYGRTQTRARTLANISKALGVTPEEFADVENAFRNGTDPQHVFAPPTLTGDVMAVIDRLTVLEKAQRVPLEHTATSPQPRLDSGITENEGVFFYFGARNFDLLDREKELRQLVDFALSESTGMSWTVISGPAGAGKSRLAMEAALKMAKEHGWSAGFLENLNTFDWTTWRPNAPTLMIVDYAASRLHAVLVAMREIMSGPASQQGRYPIRLVLIERTSDAITEPLLLESRDTIAANASFSRLVVNISGLKSPFALVALICGKSGKDISDDLNVQKRYETFDPAGRPLFAMLFAYSLLDEDLYGADLITICREILRRWETKFWALADLKLRDRILLALATVLGGAAVEELKALIELPAEPMHNINAALLRAKLSKKRDYVSSLEPDLLGELFVLDQFSAEDVDPAYIVALISRTLEKNEILVLEFLKRAVDDFPDHDAIRLFVSPLLEANAHAKTIRSDLLLKLPSSYLKKHVSKDEILLGLEYASTPNVTYFPREDLPIALGLDRRLLEAIAIQKIDHFSTFFYDTHLTTLNGLVWKFYQSGLTAVVSEVLDRLLGEDLERFSEFLLSSPAEQVFRLLETCRHNGQFRKANQIEEIIIRNAQTYLRYGFSVNSATITTICRVNYESTHGYPLTARLIAEMKRAMFEVDVRVLLLPALTQVARPYEFLPIIDQHDSSLLQHWAEMLFAQDVGSLGLNAYTTITGRHQELIEALTRYTNPKTRHSSWEKARQTL